MSTIKIEDCKRDSEGRPIIPNGFRLEPMQSTQPAAKAQKATKQASKKGHRFLVLNAFVDFTMRDLTPSERLVWFVLYRDVRNGVATSAQSDIAERSGLTQSTVSHALKRLVKRELVQIVRQGGFRKGVSTYKIRGSV